MTIGFTSEKRVHAVGPANQPKLAIVGMAPAAEELIHGKPFMGPAGHRLDEGLSSNGIRRSDVYITNISERAIPVGNSLFNLPDNLLEPEIERFWREIEKVRPNCLLVLGGDTLNIVTGRGSLVNGKGGRFVTGAVNWRGSILSSRRHNIKCVASLHPAFIIRGMFKWLPVFKHIDMARWKENGEFPDIRYPKRTALVSPNFKTCLDYIKECEQHDLLSFDIETVGYQ